MAEKSFRVKNTITINGVELDLSGATVNETLVHDGTKFIATDRISSVTVNSSSATTFDSFSGSTYRSAEYLIQVTQTQTVPSTSYKYTMSKVLVIHNGTTATMAEYGVIEVGTSRIPMSLSATYTSGNIVMAVQITDASASNSAVVKFIPTYMAV